MKSLHIVEHIYNFILKCKLCNPRGGVNWDIKIFMQYNSHNNLIYYLNQIKTINSFKHNIKSVREEKTNTRIFTRFGYPRLRFRARGFHYPSLSRLQMFTIDFQGVNESLQPRDYLSNLFTPSDSHTYTLTN